MPFGEYRDFADCERQNRDKRDPGAYCGSIKSKTEKAVNSASYLRQSVRAAVEAVVKHKDKQGSTAHHEQGGKKPRTIQTRTPHEHPTRGVTHQHPTRGPKFVSATESSDIHFHKMNKGHDPVKEEGKKKLTESEGTSAEGAQDDQAFAVAFGPDNYDELTKAIIAAPYQQAYNAAGTILKALENKQFNFPGNIEEHMKKAHAAIHGREMWDARYGDVCDLITQARKILHSIEKTAEVSQGGSGMMVVGKADPGTPAREPSKPRGPRQGEIVGPSGWQTSEQRTRGGKRIGKPKVRTYRPGAVMGKAKPGGPPIAREDYPKIPSGPGYGQRPRPVGKAGDYDFHPGKPPARPKPKAGAGNVPASGFPHRGAAYKAVRKAIEAVRGR